MKKTKFTRIRMVFTLFSIGCLLFIILEGPIGPYLVQPATFEQSMQRWTGTLNTHTPIRITSNANFTTLNGVTGGSGTPADPWIIENWMIFADGIGSPIFVANTTDYLVIRHCSLWEAEVWFCESGTTCNEELGGKYDWEVGGDAGIVLLNVTNARLEDNNCYSNGGCGIYVESSSNNLLQDNWCWDNDRYGIVIQNSVNTTLLNNNCTNVEKGIRLKTCNYTLVQYNTVWNTWVGLDIEYMYVNNCISKNRIENSKFGIFVELCTNVLVEQNAFRNVWRGMSFCAASGNTIRENSFDRTDIIIQQNYCVSAVDTNTIGNNHILPNSPLFFGYYCFFDTSSTFNHNWDADYLFRFIPGVLGWLLFPITIFMWMIFPIKKKIILPFKEKIAREKQVEILRVLNIKEEYYVQLQKEHENVLKQLNDETQMKEDQSKGD